MKYKKIDNNTFKEQIEGKTIKITELEKQIKDLQSQIVTYTDREYLDFGKAYLNDEQQMIKNSLTSVKLKIKELENYG